MQSMLIKQRRQGGFTLVEIAVVVPMMILIVLALMALLIALVNSIALPTKQNTLVSTQGQAFDAISSDITNSSGFLADDVTSDFNDPNKTGSWDSPPTNTDVLIIQGYNQTKDPADTTGTQTLPAFKGTSPCAVSALSKDNVVPIAIIYFVKDSILWRRVLTATSPGPLCSSPLPLLIQQTCPPAPSCTNEDTPLTKATVTEFKVTYYTDNQTDAIATDKSTAQSVLLFLKNTSPSGDNISTSTLTLRVSRLSH